MFHKLIWTRRLSDIFLDTLDELIHKIQFTDKVFKDQIFLDTLD